ncbi:hypothetical protein ACOL3H_07210 [Aliarcobacter butzleri]
MKKSLLSLAAIAVLTLNISGCATKQEVKEKSVCPVLNIENTTKEQFDEAKGLIESLRFTIPTVETVYVDILKHYNKVDNVDKYITKDGLTNLANNTTIFATLIAMNHLSAPFTFNGNATTYELITKYQGAYKEILNTIDANNPNWCELESYKHVTDKYTKK